MAVCTGVETTGGLTFSSRSGQGQVDISALDLRVGLYYSITGVLQPHNINVIILQLY